MEVARRKFIKPPVKVACLACRASRIRCDGKQDCKTCLDRGRECVYKKSKRGGARYRATAESIASSSNGSTGSPKIFSDADSFDLEEGLYYHSTFSLPGAGLANLDGMMDQGSESSFVGTEMSGGMETTFSNSRSTRADQPEVTPGGQILFPSPLPFVPEGLNRPTATNVTEPEGPINIGNMSTADMFKAISDLERSKKPMLGVRHYGSDAAILNAYYIYIHPVFPILPAPVYKVVADDPLSQAESLTSGYVPYSPICLAISAIMALIPLFPGKASRSPDAKTARRNQAHDYATACLNSIDVDTELVESMIAPQEALQKHFIEHGRAQFHPDVPLSLESILALLILTVYEYSQRGNMTKMRARAGQALVMALDMGLCDKEQEGEQYAEARRRAWWMTYVCVCHGTIAKNAPLKSVAMDLYDLRFQVGYPVVAADPGVFEFFCKAQQAVIAANTFANDLNDCIEDDLDLSEKDIYRRQANLETFLDALCKEADLYAETNPSNLLADADEAVVGRALRAISRIRLNSARIKIHRYTAFMNIPIFSQNHCGLPTNQGQTPQRRGSVVGIPTVDGYSNNTIVKAAHPTTPPSNPVMSQLDYYSNDTFMKSAPNILLSQSAPGISTFDCCSNDTVMNSGPSASIESGLVILEVDAEDPKAPFSREASSKICRTAALNIVQSFHTLPYPSPLAISAFTSDQFPRAMPVFACCAMQCSYALLMLCHKASTNHPEDDIVVQGYVDHLRQALRLILRSLENYSTAFEALDGMRGSLHKEL